MLEKDRQQRLKFFSNYLHLFQKVADTSDDEIVSLCEKLIVEMRKMNFEYHNYWDFKREWDAIQRGSENEFEKLLDCSLNTYLAFLTYFSREEHMSGDYGTFYINGVKNGKYEFILTQIVNRLAKEETDKNNKLGIAGEFYTAAELTRRGYVASLTSKNTQTIDLLASSKDGKRSVCIQIKTCSNKKMNTWKMSKSSEQGASNHLYYVFVNLCDDDPPKFFVVPSTIVAKRIADDYLHWKKKTRKDGAMHPETDMRTFKLYGNDLEQYQNAWSLLGLD